MATYKTRGLVLRRYNLGEADRIIHFLTPDRGKVRAVSRGVRKIGSRQAGHLELFAEVDLMLAEGRNLDIVTSARLVRYDDGLMADYDRLRLAYLAAEMLDKLTDDSADPIHGLYHLASRLYRALPTAADTNLLELEFKLHLADDLGYRPGIVGCGSCGASEETRGYDFSPAGGGLLCEGCTTPGALAMSHRQIKLWRLLLDRPGSTLQLGDGLAREGIGLVDHFYDYVFGRQFVSASIL